MAGYLKNDGWWIEKNGWLDVSKNLMKKIDGWLNGQEKIEGWLEE